ncbi:MAG: hypothetical protein HY578_00945 [Nitrospinae bacterium]|nr:hypothetical protein [Nitrospinota bacterium]
MKINSVKRRLKKGEVVLGVSIGIAEPTLVEILGYAGFDFVLLNAEHNALTTETINSMIVSAYASDIIPIYRIPSLDNKSLIKTGLDMGAMGILVPNICDSDEARMVVKAAQYPPKGKRGVGPRRPIQFGKIGLKEYLNKADEEILICMMIEDKEAIENIDRIVEIPGIDCLVVGPFDLSASLGVPGEYNHPSVTESVSRVLNAALPKGIAVGYPVEDKEGLSYWVDKGVRFFECGSVESFITRQFTNYLETLRNGINTKNMKRCK